MPFPTQEQIDALKIKDAAGLLAALLRGDASAVIDSPLGPLPSVAHRTDHVLRELLPTLLDAAVAKRIQSRLSRLAQLEARVQQLEQQLTALSRPAPRPETFQRVEAPALPQAATRRDVLLGAGSGFVTPPELRHALDVEAQRLRGALAPAQVPAVEAAP